MGSVLQRPAWGRGVWSRGSDGVEKEVRPETSEGLRAGLPDEALGLQPLGSLLVLPSCLRDVPAVPSPSSWGRSCQCFPAPCGKGHQPLPTSFSPMSS